MVFRAIGIRSSMVIIKCSMRVGKGFFALSQSFSPEEEISPQVARSL
jgi:hypothetical protein